jgi:hypothetical protein
MVVDGVSAPLVKLGNRVKRKGFVLAGDLDDRGDELLEEVLPQQLGPVVVQEVDQQTLYVRTILNKNLAFRICESRRDQKYRPKIGQQIIEK